MSELSPQAISIQSVYSMYREDKIVVNRRYQRKLVWTKNEKEKLIESIFKKYPIPAILLAEKSPGEGYEVIDGLQRLHAIVSYIENSFPNPDGKYFDVNYFTTAKSYLDSGIFNIDLSNVFISQKEVSNFLDYNLQFSIMRNASESEINDVFSRINTYGHRLSDQERRQAGVESEFSKMVRDIACNIRGDDSPEILPLNLMPSISIDLPTAKHGYAVKSEDVFWIQQGILRSNDLRDSMDEQCIADVAACIVGGTLVERSKEALDNIYDETNPEHLRINSATSVYGSNKFAEEFKYCLDQILTVCSFNNEEKLRDIIFEKRNTNPFQATFAIIFVAFHELIVGEKLIISDYLAVKNGLKRLAKRIDTSRSSILASERRRNVETIKSQIRDGFASANVAQVIYGNHALTDIESIIRRTSIELSDYELKQGLLNLSDDRKIDENLVEKILQTICAIANNGPTRSGKLILGVADKDSDAVRVKKLDSIEAKKIGEKYVVGINREAKFLKISKEQYYTKWKNIIKDSKLSDELKISVLSHIDFNEYYGLGIIVITIPSQTKVSYYDSKIYWRKADSTYEASDMKTIVEIAQRF